MRPKGLLLGLRGLKSGLNVRILGLDSQWEGKTDGRTDGRLEITPCVLQDIGPLGPLPKKLKNDEKVNSRKSVRWSAIPVAPVCVCVMVRGAAAPKEPMT